MENSRSQGNSAQGAAYQSVTNQGSTQGVAVQEPMSQPDPYERQPRRGLSQQGTIEASPWKENHGNLLLAILITLCLIGVVSIAWQQANEFNPPQFPSLLNTSGDGSNNGQVSSDIDAANSSQELRTVELRIIGAASDLGLMKIAIYATDEGFNDPARALDVDSWKIVNGVCSGKLQMPASIRQLAICAYHDENMNDQLDKNSLGIPSERYGFSGGARGLTGPPSYAEAKVSLGDKPIDISIR